MFQYTIAVDGPKKDVRKRNNKFGNPTKTETEAIRARNKCCSYSRWGPKTISKRQSRHTRYSRLMESAFRSSMLPKLSVLLYFSILGEKPLNIGAIQESCTCESQKSVIRRKVTPNLHTCAAEAQKEREPVSRFPLKKCLLTGRLSGID